MSVFRVALTAVCLCVLVACGNSGSGSAGVAVAPPPGGSTPASNPGSSAPGSGQVNPSAPVSKEDAARFLTQATFGPSTPEINKLAASTYGAWLDEQFAMPMSEHLPAVPKYGDTLTPQFVGQYPVLSSFWTKAAIAPDQLRMRTSYALSQIFVISMRDMNVLGYPQGIASYMDMLSRNAFGNFRQLLEDVTLHPMMGLYLSHLGNQKEDAASGRIPDENFAREILQLFSIGLVQLNPDGTVKKDANGKPIETYTNADIGGLARVFTGWSWSSPTKDEASFQPFRGFGVNDDRGIKPMEAYAQFHSTSEKKFLGKTIAAGAGPQESLKQALDHIFNHPNVGPFIGRQLIQRLVSSNPSPAYVSRVAAAFDNNGQGVRGDMKAVLRAVLLDTEARDRAKMAELSAGKLREPVMRLAAWIRAFNVTSASGNYNVFFIDEPTSGIGQAPMRSPSVFNFYRPGYVPPNTAIAKAGLVAPEMQIASETSASAYVNLVQDMAFLQSAGFVFDLRTDYAAEKAVAADPEKLIEHMNLLMTYGSMTDETKATLREALNSIPSDAIGAVDNRVRLALLFTLTSPDFLVQR
jgi:uncharacterized protein (DUF1800 family)